MIANTTNIENIKKSVDQNLVKEIQEVKNWRKTVDTVQLDDRYKIHKYKKRTTILQTLVTPNFDFRFKIKQYLQDEMFKALQKQQAQQCYANKKAVKQNFLRKVQNSKRQILSHLNRVIPNNNISSIFQEMQHGTKENSKICNMLIKKIIKESWKQPKCAASHTKLSSQYGQIDGIKFNNINKRLTKNRNNLFDIIPSEKEQYSFDKKQKKESLPEKQDLEKFARQTKDLLIGNVKFIAELIKIKLIPKRAIKYCIFQLMSNFLEGYQNFFVKNDKTLNFYEFNFEALIQFLENLGEKYESIEEKQKDKGQKGQKEDPEEANTNEKASNYKEVEETLKQICLLQKPYCLIQGYDNLKANEYFYSFKVISDLALPKVKDGGRIRALLQNLEQRRFSNWKKHHVKSQSPNKPQDYSLN